MPEGNPRCIVVALAWDMIDPLASALADIAFDVASRARHHRQLAGGKIRVGGEANTECTKKKDSGEDGWH